VSGHREETERLVKFFEPYGLIEFVRSARVAITKASLGFHQTLKEFEKKEPSPDDVVENKYLDKKEEVFTM
jgi:acetolactate synthase-1/3 small subunit